MNKHTKHASEITIQQLIPNLWSVLAIVCKVAQEINRFAEPGRTRLQQLPPGSVDVTYAVQADLGRGTSPNDYTKCVRLMNEMYLEIKLTHLPETGHLLVWQHDPRSDILFWWTTEMQTVYKAPERTK